MKCANLQKKESRWKPDISYDKSFNCDYYIELLYPSQQVRLENVANSNFHFSCCSKIPVSFT